MLDQPRISQHPAARAARKTGDRHAPDPLPRETPVGTIGDHPVDSVLPPGRNPSYTIDFRQGLLAQIVDLHRDEPLLGRPEDYGSLAAPAVGIGMGQRSMAPQSEFLSEHVNY